MTSILELCRDAVVAPGRAARTALQTEQLGALVLLFGWGVIAEVVAYGISEGGLTLGAAAAVIGSFAGAAIVVLVGGAVVHMSAGLLGGEAQASAALRVLALTFLPNIFLPPFALAGSQAFIAARLVVAGWQLVLLVVGVREAYRIETGTAVLTLAAPVLVVLVGLPLLMLAVMAAGLTTV